MTPFLTIISLLSGSWKDDVQNGHGVEEWYDG